MVSSIFIRRVPELKVGMNRLRRRLNDEDENDDDVSLSPPHIDELPAPLTDSRDPRESLGTSRAVDVISALAFATMSNRSYDESEMKSSSFEEQRDDQRSAFSNVRTEAVKTEEEEEEEKQPAATDTATESVHQPGDDDTDIVRRSQEESLLYYRPQHHQQQADEDADVKQYQYQRQANAAQQYHQSHIPQQYLPSYNPQQYHQSQNIYAMGHYSYPPAFNEYPERYAAAASVERSDLQYPHQPRYPREYGYPQHYPQEYGYHEQDYNPQYAYHPSVIAANRLGQYYYPERATTMPHSVPQPDTLSTTPSAVTDSIGRPSMEEDNRKPAARSSEQQQEQERQIRESRIAVKKEEEGTADFEPIPLYQMSAGFSSQLAPSQMYATGRLTQSSHSEYSQAFAQGSRGGDVLVAPPKPYVAPTPRTQSRVLVPSSSGSNASSTGGEGGSWEKRYAELCEFKRIHGHCEVPQAYSDNNSLGTWVNKVRISNCTKMTYKCI